jgi:hypothetical protein
MKTNLTALYKTDKSFEKDGIWMAVGNGVEFKVRRFGGENSVSVAKAMAKFNKPYAAKMQSNSMTQEETNLVDAQILAEALISDWKGIKDDNGVELECTFQNVVSVLAELPELMAALMRNATDFNKYKVEFDQEEVGNS